MRARGCRGRRSVCLAASVAPAPPRKPFRPSSDLAHGSRTASLRSTMQAVRPSLRALHASLMNHLRVPVVATGASWGNGHVRTMSEEAHAHGTYLDRRDVIDRVLSVVKSSQKVDASKVSETATFKDMGLDSLDEVEVVMALEEEFALEIPDADADKIRSATDAIDYIASHPRAK